MQSECSSQGEYNAQRSMTCSHDDPSKLDVQIHEPFSLSHTTVLPLVQLHCSVQFSPHVQFPHAVRKINIHMQGKLLCILSRETPLILFLLK